MRYRRASSLGFVLAALMIALGTPSNPALAQALPGCQPGEPVRFRFGIGELYERLGPIMGTPLDCERAQSASGQTVQPTTTGTASYDPANNTPMFTTGTTHYALYLGRLVQWRGEDATLPLPTPNEQVYLDRTEPFRTILDALQAQLDGYQQVAAAGHLDAIDTTDLGALTRELFAAHAVFEGLQPPARLDRYGQTVTLALDRAYTAASLLRRAQARDDAAMREALVREAADLSASSGTLFNEASDELRALLPTVAQ